MPLKKGSHFFNFILMLKAKLFFFGALILFSGILIYSCTKDGVKNETQDKVTSENDIETLKSILKITDEETASVRTESTCGAPDCYLLLPGVSETVYIDYYGCSAKVTYDLYRCFTSGSTPTTVTEIFKNFKAVPIESMGCTALLDAWTVLYNNGDYNGLAAELDLFNSKASEAVEKARVNYFFTSQSYMQTFFRCGNNNKYIIEFYMDNCFKWCISYTTDSGKPVWDFVRTSCADNCCKRTRQYCWSQATATQQAGPIISPGSESTIQVGVCSEAQEANCGIGYVKSESCFHQCFPQ